MAIVLLGRVKFDMQYLAAVHFEDGQDIDELLAAFVQKLLDRGLEVRGVLQTRVFAGAECHCADMDLHAIGSDVVFRISQSLGNGARGCRLHSGALADCSSFLDRQLQDCPQLLVLNRFGKGESEGGGFRDLIFKALSMGIPVLIAVRPTYREAWNQFSGNLGLVLPFDFSATVEWFNAMEQAKAA